MKISPKRIVGFFDQKSKDGNHDGSDVSAIIGLLGEDLLLGVLQHYWTSSEGTQSKILAYKCTNGSLKGPRLDGWLLKNARKGDELYQVEVKNWAAYAIGGKELKPDASEQELQNYSERNWNRFFAPEAIPGKHISKVLEKMKRPAGYEHLTPVPLICFWICVSATTMSPYSIRKYASGKQVHIFSASAYLRTLGDDHIHIAMPRAKRRLGLLTNLISTE